MVDSIRCIKVSPDGTELASGDEVGNVRIHSLEGQEILQKRSLEAHDSEVISLAYSASLPRGRLNPDNASTVGKQRFVLASGGRDKQILLYDSERNYEAFLNLDHHNSTITSLEFNEYSSVDSKH